MKPQLVINLQIHIDARASEQQIDQIFAAWSKYLGPPCASAARNAPPAAPVRTDDPPTDHDDRHP